MWISGGRATKLDTLVPGKDFASPEEFSRVDEALPTLDRAMMAKDWKDDRVKAALMMAPAWSWLFDEAHLNKISIPTYIIAGLNDEVLVTRSNAGYFARNIPQSIYNEIPGKGGHYIFISALNDQQRKLVDPKKEFTFLYEDDVSVDRQWIQMQVIEQADGFFDSVLNKGQ